MFRLTDGFLSDYKGKQPKWGYNGMGYIIYKRSYSRYFCNNCGSYLIDGDGHSTADLHCEECGGKGIEMEEFWQTCKRVVEGTFELQKRHVQQIGTRWNAYKAQKSAQEMYRLMWEFKFLPPGRGLWAMGSPIVMDRGIGTALFNCGFRSTETIDFDFADPYCFLFEASALGVGIGFDTRGKGKVEIVRPSRTEETMVIADSREGWSAALRRVLMGYIGKGSLPRFDYSEIRPFGAPIKTFGGTASGPEALRELLEADLPEVLTQGRITTSQIVDIGNVIGKCVVAGGARRSSEIALGDIEDREFTRLKEDEDKLRRYRWNSNNSHFVPELFDDYHRFVDPISSKGEPGFIWLHNMQRYGRMIDSPTDADNRVMGVNPCGEQTLEDGELCNVVETYPAHCDSLEEFLKVLKYGYLYGKTVTLTNTQWARTNEIMLRNRRIGLSMSGIIQNINKVGFSEHIRWCDEGYKYLQPLDRMYSEWLCIRESVKKTTVKPSGSVSLLCGATPGIHYPHSKYCIRRVRFTRESSLLQALEKAGYHAEPDFYDNNTVVVSFPTKEGHCDKTKEDTTIWEQLENAAQMQAYWSDNSVSITVDIKPVEFKDIHPAMVRYQSRLKAVSFLPVRKGVYVQPPYEAITEEQYDSMVKNLKPLNLHSASHEVTDKFCDSDVCQT